MKIWEIVLIVVGVAVFVWLIDSLNTFVGGEGLFTYVGGLASIGFFVIVVGWFFLIYVKADAGIKD